MSIYGDKFITREKAKEMVKRQLLYEQEKLVTFAVESMLSYELEGYLNRDGDTTRYNIEDEDES